MCFQHNQQAALWCFRWQRISHPCGSWTRAIFRRLHQPWPPCKVCCYPVQLEVLKLCSVSFKGCREFDPVYARSLEMYSVWEEAENRSQHLISLVELFSPISSATVLHADK